MSTQENITGIPECVLAEPKTNDQLTQSVLKAIEKNNKIAVTRLSENQALFIETNPIPVKKSLSLMSMIEDELRLPLYKLEEKNEIILMNVLKNYKLI